MAGLLRRTAYCVTHYQYLLFLVHLPYLHAASCDLPECSQIDTMSWMIIGFVSSLYRPSQWLQSKDDRKRVFCDIVMSSGSLGSGRKTVFESRQRSPLSAD
jgi:hypothetical protein